MMIKWDNNEIELEGKKVSFPFDIDHVIAYNETFLILLNIPENEDEINNIYCVDQNGRLLWQSEDLNEVRKGMLNLPYEAMEIKGEYLFAADFYGRCYKIDPKDGKVLECKLKK